MMNPSEQLSLNDFNRKLRKYCTKGAELALEERELVKRMESILHQRDACLAFIAQEKERENLLNEEIEDIQHQHDDALEMLAALEKRVNKLKTAHSVGVTNNADGCAAQPKVEENVEDKSAAQDDMLSLRWILRKYCNLYVKFPKQSNTVQVLSLEKNNIFEISLNDHVSAETRANIWSKIGACSTNLSSWENLL